MERLTFFNRIHWKLMTIYILLILIAMQVIGAYFFQAVEAHYVNNFTRMLDQQASLFAYSVQDYVQEASQQEGEQQSSTNIDHLIDQMFSSPTIDIQVLDKNGIVIASSSDKKTVLGQRNVQIEVKRALLGTRDEAIRINPNNGHRVKILSLPIKVEDEVVGALFIMASMEEMYRTIGQINRILVSGTLIALLCTAGLGIILARTITQPIKQMTKQASAMAQGDFTAEAKVYGQDEIGQLAQAFNHLSQQLRKALAENEEEERNRKAFVANVSHELRTPLTTMRSYLEALQEGVLTDPELGPKFIKVTQQETERMIRIVNDLLLLSKMDSKRYQLQLQETDLQKLLAGIVERFALQLQQENLQVELHVDEDLPLLLVDRDQMTQVLDNLISNAIKYSPVNLSIYIGAKRVEDHVLLSIRDEGIGIPEEELPNIFRRFYRVDKARSREMGGTGLGLSIAKEMVLAHGGSIEIESKPEQGTTVWIRLPCQLERGA